MYMHVYVYAYVQVYLYVYAYMYMCLRMYVRVSADPYVLHTMHVHRSPGSIGEETVNSTCINQSRIRKIHIMRCQGSINYEIYINQSRLEKSRGF